MGWMTRCKARNAFSSTAAASGGSRKVPANDPSSSNRHANRRRTRLGEQEPLPGFHVAKMYGPRMEVSELAHLRRARDLLDREYARPLDVPTMARAALMSPSLFSRRFREAYGDTPYGYLQARRVERAMALLRRGDMSVTDVCMAVGFTSLGSFSSTFTRLVGEPPSVYRARDHSRLTRVPPCMTHAWARPGWVAQPCRIGEAFVADRA
jgi:AraC-like DNA-binding protein